MRPLSGSLWFSRLPGALLTLIVATAAVYLGSRFPIVGGPLFGILLGMAVKQAGLVKPRYRPGISFASKQVLQSAIVMLGAGLSLQQIWHVGLSSLWVMLSTLLVCLVAAWLLGRVMGVPPRLATLIGSGTGICGASAIAAVAPVIDADEQEVAYAVSTIFAFNVAAVLIFPVAGHLMGLGQRSFGLWAGTAVNDTSSVVAAAYAYGADAGTYATVVKLARSTFIIPLALGIAVWRARRVDKPLPASADHPAGRSRTAMRESAVTAESDSPFTAPLAVARPRVGRIFPWFILWFLAASLLHTAGVIPAGTVQALSTAGKLLIVVSLTAVGMTADFHQMAGTGIRPMLLGFILWMVVAVTSLLVQAMTHTL